MPCSSLILFSQSLSQDALQISQAGLFYQLDYLMIEGLNEMIVSELSHCKSFSGYYKGQLI